MVGLGSFERGLQCHLTRDAVDREVGVDLELIVVEWADRGRLESDLGKLSTSKKSADRKCSSRWPHL